MESFMLPFQMLTLKLWNILVYIRICVTGYQNLNIMMIRTMKFWAFWQKYVNYFWQSVDTILEEMFVA